jgi:hypothetical protein
MTNQLAAAGRCRVRVLFGQNVIRSYAADPEIAARYAAAVSQRFIGFDVRVDDRATGLEPPVPCEQLWDLAPV